ncbi:ArsR/SmtB family transcription factor [Acerihabitans arboris]|uniref:Metalloregulator ArsR/SmtB family transcription factor n=1 Tax=Acerihabitans arboris TaxID=2691583 RepID=A0A845SXR6_9GAMM|nr:metalloregulator ArsR/SmtB family transcription factor [Acerihabitans arboris]NDL65665.1 metalloregulator ArsR/SmtB family transcription factor [Acerihabitans arboris]
MPTTDILDVKVKLLRGFADRTRLGILNALQEKEMTVGELVARIGGGQSNISQHLACLRGCGVINKRQEGKYCYYALAGDRIGELLAMVDSIMVDIRQDVACCGLNDRLLPPAGGE